MKKILNQGVALFVIVIVLLLIIPMNTFFLDVMIIVNISLSLIILLISMNIKEALEFSIFPSLLLITTLFRLGINVSSTRNILRNQGEAGMVIQSFGDFVLQGDAIVGFIIFIIIVLVQFIVITKGAERVAEVAARFTLDAMPGKQMAIDADLSAGLITEAEAKARRSKIQREADFYGAMDGATKIVKGDAIMSIIITAINLIGGSVIGMISFGMSLTDVMNVYSIATVGDGLVSQIPALLISTATGMIVTRAVSEGSLNDDVSKQFLAQPRAIMMTGGIILIIMMVPGMPVVPMFVLGVAFIVSGIYISRKLREKAERQLLAEQTQDKEEIPATEEEYYKDINNVYSLISVEPIEMEFGYSLIPLVDERSGGKLIDRIVIFRRQYAQTMGFVVPSVRLRDSSNINTNQYVIKIKGEEVARGELLVDYFLALEPPNPTGKIDGIDTIEPAYGIPSKWVLPENKEMAEIYGYTIIDPLSVMVTHLSETIRLHSHELLSRQEVALILQNVKSISEELVDEVVPNIITPGNLQKILVTLLEEGIPIRDMETILETIAENSTKGLDFVAVTENIRTALKRTITRRFCEDGKMRVITLESELEKMMVAGMNKGEQGIFIALSPDVMQSVMSQINQAMKKFQELSQETIILTSQVIRPYLYQLLKQFYPNIYVLSFSEIGNNIQIQAISNIKVSTKED